MTTEAAVQQTTVKCEDCGLLYQDFPIEVTVTSEQWIELTGYREGEGILCGACIVSRGSRKYAVGRLFFEGRRRDDN